MTLEVENELEHLKAAARVAGVEPAEFTLPEHHQAILGKMRFHYVDWGAAGKTPIVFLHGGALSARTWDLVCLDLRSDYHCIALDQRGHGDSEWSPVQDYGIGAYVEDLERFVDHLGLDRFLLVGMSLGAAVTASYASQHSDRLLAAVIIDAGPEPRMGGGERIRNFVQGTSEMESLDDFVDKALTFNPRRDRDLLKRSILNNVRQKPDGTWVRKNDTRHMNPERFPQMIEDIKEHWSNVDRIGCPVLVVRGAESDVFYEEDAQKLVSLLRDGRSVTVEGAGHTVQGDNPAGLIRELRSFFDGINVEA